MLAARAALAALRYRWADNLVLVLLSALVSTCLVLAPLYTRALEQATTRTLLQAATPDRSGVRLESTSSTTPAAALAPDALVALVPASVRALLGPPRTSTAVDVRRLPLVGEPGGRLLSRDGLCDGVDLTAGRCPTAAGEVAVSGDQAKVYGTPLGSTLEVGEFDGAVSLPEAAPRTTLRVVGVYLPTTAASPSGPAEQLTGRASKRLGYDVLLTPPATLADQVSGPDGRPTSWFQPRYAVDLPLLVDEVGADEIGPLGAGVAELVRHPLGAARAGSVVAQTVTVSSGLPAVADEVRVGGQQASVTVPLLMAQLGLLLACVLWLVLVATADARRGEVAVARLRGRGARGARRLLLRETVPPVTAGAGLGAFLGLACSTVARHSVLSGDPPLEVPLSAVAALVLAVVVLVGLATLSVGRVSREPVAALLRSVPPRRSGVRLGVLEAMLVAAALAAFVALVTGSVGGAVGQVAPTLLALAVGVVGARVTVWALAVGGRRLLRRGHPTAGAALLTSSRRSTTRWLVPVVAVAMSTAVVSADVLAVGARSWTGRAQAEVGAPTVLTLDSVDLTQVAGVLRAVDPTGEHVTPVALLGPTVDGGTTTVGVVPDDFARIASWPGVVAADLPWSRLTAPAVPPLRITGTRVRYHVEASAVELVEPVLRAAPTALALGVRVVRTDGTVAVVGLGTLPATGVSADQEAPLDCPDGCRVTGIGVLTPRGAASVAGRVTVSDLSVDSRPVDLGGRGAWRDTTVDATSVRSTPSDGALRLDYTTDGFEPALLAHASVPDVVPALTTPAAAPSSPSATSGGSYVDGSLLLLRSQGSVPFVPGGPVSTSVVHLDNLLAQGWRGRGSAVLEAYVDTRDPVYLSRLRDSLAARGLTVASARDTGTVAAAYGRSAAAWSVQLALAVGVLSLLVAAAGVVVLASSSARARSRDYAVLRLVGQRRRATALLAQLETAPVVVTSAVLGAAVGLWAAPAAVGLVPLFTSPPPTYPVPLGTAWVPALLAALGGLLLLAATSAVTSHTAARHADPTTLRESG